MRLDIEAIEERGYLRLRLSGHLASAFSEAVEQYARIAAITSTSGYTRYLIDARAATTRMSVPEAFEFVSLAVSEEALPGDRTAALELPEHHLISQFYENMMRSRGRVFRVFTEEAAALAWLFSEEP